MLAYIKCQTVLGSAFTAEFKTIFQIKSFGDDQHQNSLNIYLEIPLCIRVAP